MTRPTQRSTATGTFERWSKATLVGASLLLGACDSPQNAAIQHEGAPVEGAMAAVEQPVDAVLHPRDSGPLPFYRDATFTPQWIEPGAAELDGFHRVAPFELTNQDGETVTQETFGDKIYITDFFFSTCPGICKAMTQNMVGLQDTFADDPDVLFLSHSVTPDIDDVEQLALYAEAHGVKSGKWHLVTGERSDIYALGRRSYFVDENQGEDVGEEEFLHTENFVLVDQKRHIRGIYNGLNKASLQQLVADVERLKREG